MRNLIERVIEGCDRGNQIKWFANRKNFTGLTLRRDIARKNLTVILERFHGGKLEDVLGTTDFVAGLPHTEARLAANQVGKFIGPLRKQRASPF